MIHLTLSVRGCRPGKTVNLTEGEIRALCVNSREVFLSEGILLELPAPIKICGSSRVRHACSYSPGDVHGQYYDLLRLFEFSGFPPRSRYLFLGDYVDRGKQVSLQFNSVRLMHQSLETICLLLAFKIKYPNHVYLLRGNHECASINRIYGFYDECL